MTEIRVIQQGEKSEITIMGHCNAGRINGFDLCCCAVSMLTHTLLKSLKKLDLPDFEGRYGGGWCYVSFGTNTPKYEKAETIIETVMNGFGMLADSYPANVKIYSN